MLIYHKDTSEVSIIPHPTYRQESSPKMQAILFSRAPPYLWLLDVPPVVVRHYYSVQGYFGIAEIETSVH